MPSPWIVSAKGGPNETAFEIAVVRENNLHGIQSYGWFDHNKLLITHNGGPCQWPVVERVWRGALRLAQEVADEMNAKEHDGG